MKKSDLVRIIREELKAIKELSQPEKDANIKAANAELEAKKLALKSAQDRANKMKATPVDQK